MRYYFVTGLMYMCIGTLGYVGGVISGYNYRKQTEFIESDHPIEPVHVIIDSDTLFIYNK